MLQEQSKSESSATYAGRDIVEESYVVPTTDVTLPITSSKQTKAKQDPLTVKKAFKIPTEYHEPSQDVMPDRLLEMYLNHHAPHKHNVGSTRRSAKFNKLIEVDVQETILKKAAPVTLNAVFDQTFDDGYDYTLKDLDTIVNQPPTAIQITKIPKRGSMRTKVFGKEKVLEVGDIVPAETMEDFVYD